MALELDSPNIGYIMDVLKERGMNPRQLSKQVFGKETHRDIVKEITTKPDVRASTVLKLCRALGITMDSLYQSSDTNSVNYPSINGIGIVNNSPHAHIDLSDLRAENKALKMVLEEKDKRLAEQSRYIKELGDRLDMVLRLQNNASDSR